MKRPPKRRTRAYAVAAENIHRGRARARGLRRLRGRYPGFDALVRALGQVETACGRIPRRRVLTIAVDVAERAERASTVGGRACPDAETVVLDGTTWALARLPRADVERVKRELARVDARARYQWGTLSDCLAPAFDTGDHPVRQSHWWEPGRRLSLAAEL